MKRQSQLFDHSGRPVCLGSEFARAGEAVVYEVSGQPNVLAKIYHKLPSPEKADKLRWMVKTPSEDVLIAVAWPTATLHEVAGGKVSGILMRRVVGYREIHTLYSPAHRNQTFPRADWAFLIRVARNCAITFATLHRHGHVVGDVNQSNVLVSNQATVTLIDCDSFQVSDGLRAFRCEVGVPLFTPPELHGRNFRDIQRTPTHDCFGLAVLIFHLLFMGRHPYSGRFLGKGDLPLERAIEEARFAFSKNAASRQMSAPPNCPTLNLVPPSLANLFERAFGEDAKKGHGRPSAHDWDAALFELERQLKHCGTDLGHRYSGHLSSCPWCELIQIGAPNFFVSVLIVTNPQGQTTAFQLEAFWAEVQRATPPPSFHSRPTAPTNSVSAAPLSPSAIPGPRPPIQRSVIQTTVGWIAVAAVVLTLPDSTRLFGINIFGAFSIWWCICKWMALKQFEVENQPWVRARNELTREHFRRENILRKTTSEIDDAERRILDLIAQAAKAFDKCKTDLREAKSKFVELENTLQAEKGRLETAKRDFQLHQFLERHFIRDAKLDGIGPTRLAQLESYGIETAADINDAVLSLVPGFGPKLCGTVLAFRWSIEARFHFDPKAAIPASEIAALNSRFAAARRDHEVRLLAGLRALREINPKVQAKLEPLNLSVQGFAIHLIQAEADVAVSRNAIASTDTQNLGTWFPRNFLIVLAFCLGVFCFLVQHATSDAVARPNPKVVVKMKENEDIVPPIITPPGRPEGERPPIDENTVPPIIMPPDPPEEHPPIIELADTFTSSIGMTFKRIKAGNFLMGTDGDQTNEKPPHRVRITHDYYLGVYEVKQSEYFTVMRQSPSNFNGDDLPVESVSWNHADDFCQRLAVQDRAAGLLPENWNYRLPTEAEWELAARAGSTGKWSHGDSLTKLGDFAWYGNNADGKTHPVGSKTPNAWGLFDMAGNVWEWCQDSYDDAFYHRFVGRTVDDPVNLTSSSLHVFRGGSWRMSNLGCRPANRGWHVPSDYGGVIGFRVALTQTRKSTATR